MKVHPVHPSECQLLVFSGGTHSIAPVRLWALGNKTLIWPRNGIVGDKPPASPVTGRVNELRPTEEVEVEDIDLRYPRQLLVRAKDGAMEIRPVIVVDTMVVA